MESFKALLTLWPLLLLVVIVAVGSWIYREYLPKSNKKADFSIYEKKQYLFDAVTELNLFRILLELFGDQYHVFPQVNYSHLIQPKKTTWEDERKYRSRIDRKSADFVLCDKGRVVPQLIIELDGSVHNFKSKRARDEFIDELARIVDLPILHLRTGNLDKEFIKNEVNQKFGIK